MLFNQNREKKGKENYCLKYLIKAKSYLFPLRNTVDIKIKTQ